MDQRLLLATGLALNAVALWQMSHLTLAMDDWSLIWPRFLQGIGMGLVFVPLQTLALSTVAVTRLANATAAFNVVRNIGSSIGIAIVTTLLTRRSQAHQATLVGHVDAWSPETSSRVRAWTEHFLAQGADPFTAERRALATLYQDTVRQAQLLAYADDFWLLSMVFFAVLLLIPFMRRVHADRGEAATERLPVVNE